MGAIRALKFFSPILFPSDVTVAVAPKLELSAGRGEEFPRISEVFRAAALKRVGDDADGAPEVAPPG
jgi:hypothetical protein